MTHVCLEAASTLAAEGIEAEVVDVLTLNPLDEETIIESVQRTHRLRRGRRGHARLLDGARHRARVADAAFDYLDAPIKTVTAADTPVPFAAVLEANYAPRARHVVAAVKEQLG